MAASSLPLHHVSGCFAYPRRKTQYYQCHGHGHGWSTPTPRARNPLKPINASVETPPFPLFQPPPTQQSPSQVNALCRFNPLLQH